MDEILLLQLKDIDIRNIFHKRNSTLLEDRVSGCRLYVGCRASIKFLIFLLTREREGEGRNGMAGNAEYLIAGADLVDRSR